jgi:hypothetical protein
MSEANSSLIDIVEPTVPVVAETSSWVWLAGLIAVLVLLAIALFVLWKYKLPAYRALQRLRKLQIKLHAGEHTAHEAALLLALELRHGLGVKRLLAQDMPLDFKQQDRARWAEFMQQLDAMLYRHDAEPSADRLAALFEQAAYWLRRYSRRSPYRKIGA